MSTYVSSDLCEHDEIREDCTTCLVEAKIDTVDRGGVSVSDDTMDQLVQRASVPSLASLFQKGKAAGLLKPVQGYAGGA